MGYKIIANTYDSVKHYFDEGYMADPELESLVVVMGDMYITIYRMDKKLDVLHNEPKYAVWFEFNKPELYPDGEHPVIDCLECSVLSEENPWSLCSQRYIEILLLMMEEYYSILPETKFKSFIAGEEVNLSEAVHRITEGKSEGKSEDVPDIIQMITNDVDNGTLNDETDFIQWLNNKAEE